MPRPRRRSSRRAATRPESKATSSGAAAGTSCSIPFRKALAGLATELGTLAEREFPEDCVTSLEAGEAAFTGFATQVDGLLRGIDSKRRVAQVRALRIYDTTLGEISKSFAEPFQAVTQVCYSPKDLASINASPKSSPEPSPSESP